MVRKKLIVWGVVLSALAFLLAPRSVGADNQVVTDCSSDADLRAKLTTMQGSGGGTLTFQCAPVLIRVTSGLPPISTNTIIDGGNKITLDGENGVQFFYVYSTGVLTLQNIVLTNGSSPGDGGAIYNEGWVILKHTTIQNSTAGASGGAIVTYGQLNIDDSILAYNKGANGGAVYPRFSAAQVSITNSVLHHNQTTSSTEGWGGAILLWDGAAVGILNSDLYSNSARHGGAIYNSFTNSSVSLQDSRIRDNIATDGNGGGIYFGGGGLTTNNVTLSGNKATNLGAGVHYAYGTFLSVIKTTFSDNASGSAGGGLSLYNASGAYLINVTFSGNSALFGGAIDNTKSTAALTNVTIFDNSASLGASGLDNGTYSGEGTTLKNTIIAGSRAGPNCFDGNAKTIVSADSNLSDDDSCVPYFNKPHDLNGSTNNPLLAPLALNGGTTQTHMLKPGSPAIDAGINDGASDPDQRGVSRPQGAAFDMGAVEVCVSKPDKPVPSKPKNNGKVKKPTVPLDWGDAYCVTTYNVTVRLGATNGVKVFSKKNLDLSQVTTTALTKGQTYVWQVIAVNSAGKTKSDWWSFKVK